MPKKSTHTFICDVTLLEMGQWKPVTLVPEEMKVAVDVPLESEYIHNLDKILESQVNGDGPGPKPILKPEALHYIVETINTVLATGTAEVKAKVDLSGDFEIIE